MAFTRFWFIFLVALLFIVGWIKVTKIIFSQSDFAWATLGIKGLWFLSTSWIITVIFAIVFA